MASKENILKSVITTKNEIVPSITNPCYTVTLNKNNVTYNLTPIVTSLDLTQNENEIAEKVTIKIYNLQHNGSWFNGIIKPREPGYQP